MATLVIENGDGLPTANSYVTLEECNEYHTCRNETDWGVATDADKTFAIIKATDYLDQHFKFTSTKKNQAQALKFPRTGITGIPVEIKKAVNIYSLFALRGQLYQRERTQTVEGEIRKQRTTNKVAGIEETRETEFVGGGTITRVQNDNRFDAIKYLIREFILIEHTDSNAPGTSSDTVERATLQTNNLTFERQ